MKKKVAGAYLLIVIYIIINNLLMASSISPYSWFISPIVLLSLTLVIEYLLPKKGRTIRYKYERLQNIIIILFIYSLLYFLSGLIFGYEYSFYGRSLQLILKNTISFISIIILEEYIRRKLVTNTENNVPNNVIISLLFAFMSVTLLSMLNNMSTFSIGIKYFSSNLAPIVISSFMLTYVSRTAGLSSTVIYRSWLRLIPVILPFIPSLPWILTAFLGILLPVVIYFNLSYFEIMYDRKERRFYLNKTPRGTTILFIITIFLILFILKCFRYYPISVLSNSMQSEFSRGDVAIIEKIDESLLEELNVYDIIYYKKDNKYIIHRIEEVAEKDGKTVYITKGDNNKNSDPWYVYEKDIIGVMKFSIPYLGYPSVWINDALNN